VGKNDFEIGGRRAIHLGETDTSIYQQKETVPFYFGRGEGSNIILGKKRGGNECPKTHSVRLGMRKKKKKSVVIRREKYLKQSRYFHDAVRFGTGELLPQPRQEASTPSAGTEKEDSVTKETEMSQAPEGLRSREKQVKSFISPI